MSRGAATHVSGIGLRLAAALGVLSSFAATALAQPPPEGVTVSLEAPLVCPGEASLRGELDRLLGDAARRGPRLEARVRIEGAEAGGFAMTVSMLRDGRASERRLAGARCATLVDAAALLTAIAHDPGAVAERGATKPEPAAAPAPPPSAPTLPPPLAPLAVPPLAPEPWRPPAPPAAGGPSVGVVARAEALFGVGDLPGVSAGVAVGLGLAVDAYRAEAGFELGLASTGTLDARPDAGADFSRVVGLVRGCRRVAPWRGGGRAGLRPGRLELDACLGLELGVLAGEGFGVADPERGSALWAAPRLDLRPSLGVVGPLSLSADVGLAIPVDPRRYVIRGASGGAVLVVHEPGPVAGRLGLGLELRL